MNLVVVEKFVQLRLQILLRKKIAREGPTGDETRMFSPRPKDSSGVLRLHSSKRIGDSSPAMIRETKR